nr:auxin response factor 2-like isoform X1 [Ipomoea batatas]
MRFEGEEAPEQRFIGTIVGIEDRDLHKWPESKWRCLKVRWNETSMIPRPDRVFTLEKRASSFSFYAEVTNLCQLFHPKFRGIYYKLISLK